MSFGMRPRADTSYPFSAAQSRIEAFTDAPLPAELVFVRADGDRRRLDKAVASSPRVALAHSASSIADGADALIIGDDPDAVARATSEVIALKDSKSRPGSGIVTFLHEALNQRGEVVCRCERAALLKSAPAG